MQRFKYYTLIFFFLSASRNVHARTMTGTRETRLNGQRDDSVLLLQRLLHANVAPNDSPLSGMITASREYGYRTAWRNRWITKINRTPRYTSLRMLRYDLICPNLGATVIRRLRPCSSFWLYVRLIFRRRILPAKRVFRLNPYFHPKYRPIIAEQPRNGNTGCFRDYRQKNVTGQ